MISRRVSIPSLFVCLSSLSQEGSLLAPTPTGTPFCWIPGTVGGSFSSSHDGYEFRNSLQYHQQLVLPLVLRRWIQYDTHSSRGSAESKSRGCKPNGVVSVARANAPASSSATPASGSFRQAGEALKNEAVPLKRVAPGDGVHQMYQIDG